MFHHHSLFESDRLRVKVKTVAIWKAVLPGTVNRRSLNLTEAYQQQIQCKKSVNIIVINIFNFRAHVNNFIVLKFCCHWTHTHEIHTHLYNYSIITWAFIEIFL